MHLLKHLVAASLVAVATAELAQHGSEVAHVKVGVVCI